MRGSSAAPRSAAARRSWRTSAGRPCTEDAGVDSGVDGLRVDFFMAKMTDEMIGVDYWLMFLFSFFFFQISNHCYPNDSMLLLINDDSMVVIDS